MLMYLFSRLLTLLAVLWLLRLLWRTVAAWKAPAQAQRKRSTKSTPIAGELKQDPQCGTYVSVAISLKSRVGGQELHFCSRKCQEDFLRARRADSA